MSKASGKARRTRGRRAGRWLALEKGVWSNQGLSLLLQCNTQQLSPRQAQPSPASGNVSEVEEPPLDTLFYKEGPHGNTVLSTWNVDDLGFGWLN